MMLADVISDIFFQKLRMQLSGPLAAALRQTVGEHDGVDAAGAGRGDAVEADPSVFEQAVEHAPGEGAVTAAALERQVDRLLFGNGRARLESPDFGCAVIDFPSGASRAPCNTPPVFLTTQS